MDLYLDASQPVQSLDPPVLLDVTYQNDPELNALRNVMFSERYHEMVKGVLMNGRLKNDLWSLGLPELEVIQGVSEVDTQTLCVHAGVQCTDTSRQNLASMLDRCNDSIHRYNIKSIVMVDGGEPPVKTSNECSSVTTLIDYYHHMQTQNALRPSNLCISPALTQRNQESVMVNTFDRGSQTKGFNIEHLPHAVPSGMKTPPDSPHAAIQKKTVNRFSAARDPSTDEDSIRSELEEEIRADFESTLEQRMAELQAGFNQEKRGLEDTFRTEFEALLAERLAEVQTEFNSKERELKATIARAEERADRESFLGLMHTVRAPAAFSHVFMSHPKLETDHGVGSASIHEMYAHQVFAATLEAKLQEGRLKDVRNQWKKSEEKLVQSKRQLEKMVRELQCYQDALSCAKNRLADAERRTRCHDCINLNKNKGERDACGLVEMSAQGEMECDKPAEATVTQCLTVPCPSCDVKQRSLRFSELHIRTMELRMSMSDRRAIQTESNVVWLVHALQKERRKRKSAQVAFQAERLRRHYAEAGAEAIAREAKSPFVVPGLLDLFLKFEGFLGDLTSV